MPCTKKLGSLELPSGQRLLQDSHSVSHGNSYCVPTSISAVTGLPVELVSKAIRVVSRKRAVRGVNGWHIKRTLSYLRVKYRTNFIARGKFGSWAKTACKDRVYLVMMGDRKRLKYGHMVAYCNGKVVCTSVGGKISAISKCLYRTCDILSVIEVVEPGFAHGNYCFQGEAPERKPSLWERFFGWFTSAVSRKGRAGRLAASQGG